MLKKNIRIIHLSYALSIIIIVVFSFFFYKKFSSLTEFSFKAEKTSQVINLIEKLNVTLLIAENNQLEFLVRKDERIIERKFEVIEETSLLLHSIQERMNKSDRQYGTFIKLKHAINLRLDVMAAVWKHSKSPDGLNYEAYFNNRKKAVEDFNMLSEKLVLYERNELEKSTNQSRHYAEIAPIYLFLILGISCIFQILSFIFILKESKKRFNYQVQLEHKIKDLNVTNAELEQIAFVASHDLQEPLRKIQTFSDSLIKKHSASLDENGKDLLRRINDASGRVKGLMGDLVSYSSILQMDGEEEMVNLNDVLISVMEAFQPIITQKKAAITIDELPQISGQKNQLYLLFYNLLENALKFSKAGTTPIINIKSEIVIEEPNENTKKQLHHFYKISVSDNGIGFDADYAHKIFIIFQRLHSQNSGYTGKGLGLAICKRVMINHKGFIMATGEIGVGATFELLFQKV